MAFAREKAAGEHLVASRVWARRFERRCDPGLRRSVDDLKAHRADLLGQLGELRADASVKILHEIVRVDQDIWRLIRGARFTDRVS
jgi:hypothetical protein